MTNTYTASSATSTLCTARGLVGMRWLKTTDKGWHRSPIFAVRPENITEQLNRLYAENPEWHDEDARFVEFSKAAVRRISQREALEDS
jgi:hypothetical protein